MKKYILSFILLTLPSIVTINAVHDDSAADIFVPAFLGGAIGGAAGGGKGAAIGLGAGLATGLIIHHARKDRYYHDYDRYSSRGYSSRECHREIRKLEREKNELLRDYNKLTDDVRKLENELFECTGERKRLVTDNTYDRRREYRRRSRRGYDCRDELEQLDRENNRIVDDYNNLLEDAQNLEAELQECRGGPRRPARKMQRDY